MERSCVSRSGDSHSNLALSLGLVFAQTNGSQLLRSHRRYEEGYGDHERAQDRRTDSAGHLDRRTSGHSDLLNVRSSFRFLSPYNH